MTTLRAPFLFVLLALNACAAGHARNGDRFGGGGGGGAAMSGGAWIESPRNVEPPIIDRGADDRTPAAPAVTREPMGMRDVIYCRVCSR